jgi:hypothetical protein
MSATRAHGLPAIGARVGGYVQCGLVSALRKTTDGR